MGKVAFWAPANTSWHHPCPPSQCGGNQRGGLSVPFLPLGSWIQALDFGLEWV